MTKNRLLILASILVLAGLVLSCMWGGSLPGAIATSVDQGSVPVPGIDSTDVNPQQGGSASIRMSNIGMPAFQPVSVSALPVQVVEVLKEFAHEENMEVANYAILLVVKNPNPDLAMLDTQCQIMGFDNNGVMRNQADYKIDLLLPGETRTIFVRSGAIYQTPISTVEFRITQQGQPAQTSLAGTILSTSKVQYWPETNIASGVFKNQSDYLISNLVLTGVLYDRQNQIMSAFDLPFGFVPPNGEAALSVSFTNLGTPARVDLFLAPESALTIQPVTEGRPTLEVNQVLFLEVSTNPEDAVTPQESRSKKVIPYFFVSNPNSDRSVGLLPYQFAAYDTQGNVLAGGIGITPVVFPGETIAIVGGEISIPAERSIANIEVQVSPLVDETTSWDYGVLGLDHNPLSAEDCQYNRDQNQQAPNFTCVIRNAWNNPISSASALAIAYGPSGNVVAIVSDAIGEVPAKGQIEIKIPTARVQQFAGVSYGVSSTPIWYVPDFIGDPARIELYVNASSAIP